VKAVALLVLAPAHADAMGEPGLRCVPRSRACSLRVCFHVKSIGRVVACAPPAPLDFEHPRPKYSGATKGPPALRYPLPHPTRERKAHRYGRSAWCNFSRASAAAAGPR
jgi:hypothetical protein